MDCRRTLDGLPDGPVGSSCVKNKTGNTQKQLMLVKEETTPSKELCSNNKSILIVNNSEQIENYEIANGEEKLNKRKGCSLKGIKQRMTYRTNRHEKNTDVSKMSMNPSVKHSSSFVVDKIHDSSIDQRTGKNGEVSKKYHATNNDDDKRDVKLKPIENRTNDNATCSNACSENLQVNRNKKTQNKCQRKRRVYCFSTENFVQGFT
ncbi:hypothetical protein PV327_006912 [Microctonus hyperodae]|uniref:Uncharacterized protein n=1 Tax=Microctonus hyperodae TaxID=165561 RepID=A0AA39F5C3_MICHY|nr:hypothetical protein PV327_006912 [Microctonus hyperodae]